MLTDAETRTDGEDDVQEERGGELPPLDYRVLNVMAERCPECLFSPHAIVDAEGRSGMIDSCVRDDTYFVCHRATIEGNMSICCRGFFDSQETRPIQLAKRLSLVRFVDAEDLPKLNPLGRRTVTADIAFLLALSGKEIEGE